MNTTRMRGDLARRTHPAKAVKTTRRRVRATERSQFRNTIATELAALKLVTV